MASIRELMLYGASAWVFLIFLKLAAPTIQKIPLIGNPVAKLAAFA